MNEKEIEDLAVLHCDYGQKNNVEWREGFVKGFKLKSALTNNNKQVSELDLVQLQNDIYQSLYESNGHAGGGGQVMSIIKSALNTYSADK